MIQNVSVFKPYVSQFINPTETSTEKIKVYLGAAAAFLLIAIH